MLVCGIDADAGVRDFEAPGNLPGRVRRVQRSGADFDGAPLGELDGVADEIGEYLPQARRIADEITPVLIGKRNAAQSKPLRRCGPA